MSKIVAVIPARWGSTRFPGKPLHPIAGQALIQRVWERCRRARKIDSIVIATDDMRIAEAAFQFGAEVTLTSPRHRSGTDRIAEVVQKMRGISHVINVQGDEPMLDPRLIDLLAGKLKGDPRIQMITAAVPFKTGESIEDRNAVKVVVDRMQNALYFSRSAIPYLREPGMRVCYYRHQGIYGYSTSCLSKFVRWKPTALEKAEQLEQLRALEHGVKIRVVFSKWTSLGVDTPADAALVEQMLLSK